MSAQKECPIITDWSIWIGKVSTSSEQTTATEVVSKYLEVDIIDWAIWMLKVSVSVHRCQVSLTVGSFSSNLRWEAGVDHEAPYLLHSPLLTSISIAHLTSSGGQTRSGGKLGSGECGQSPPGYHTAMARLLLVCSHMMKGQFNSIPKK